MQSSNAGRSALIQVDRIGHPEILQVTLDHFERRLEQRRHLLLAVQHRNPALPQLRIDLRRDGLGEPRGHDVPQRPVAIQRNVQHGFAPLHGDFGDTKIVLIGVAIALQARRADSHRAERTVEPSVGRSHRTATRAVSIYEPIQDRLFLGLSLVPVAPEPLLELNVGEQPGVDALNVHTWNAIMLHWHRRHLDSLGRSHGQRRRTTARLLRRGRRGRQRQRRRRDRTRLPLHCWGFAGGLGGGRDPGDLRHGLLLSGSGREGPAETADDAAPGSALVLPSFSRTRQALNLRHVGGHGAGRLARCGGPLRASPCSTSRWARCWYLDGLATLPARALPARAHFPPEILYLLTPGVDPHPEQRRARLR
mmetsp:Transcript_55570/g.148160  ORF Transcript_55570/g.148160 Transcript_55570/m.148160 type:complete len:365 (+) Transcript_55570:665-1759(+)